MAKPKRILSIEIFEDNIIVIHWEDKKVVRKIKNPLVILPVLMALLAIPFGTEEVKDIETWLDHVWIKKVVD